MKINEPSKDMYFCLSVLLLQCVRKKKTEMFFVELPLKLKQFWRNLVHSFLNKFTAKSRKQIPPHLSNVSLLPCETSNAHRAHTTIELLEKELQNFFQINCGLQIHQIWIQLVSECGNYVQDTHHWSGWTETATENRVAQAVSCRHCVSHLSVVSSIGPDQWLTHVLYTFSGSIPTCCK